MADVINPKEKNAKAKIPRKDYEQVYALATAHVLSKDRVLPKTLSPPLGVTPDPLMAGQFGVVSRFRVKIDTEKVLRKALHRPWYKGANVTYQFCLKTQRYITATDKQLAATENEINAIIERALELQKGDVYVVREYGRFQVGGALGRLYKFYGMDDLHGDLYNLLTDKMKAEEVLNLNGITICMRDLLNGLAFLHKLNIVHRDIKPENLLLKRRADGSIRLKIADLGTAMILRGDDYVPANSGLTGTANYCSPEMLNGRAFSRISHDLWSAGVVFSDIINLARTFTGVMEEDANGIPIPIETTEEKIASVVRQQKQTRVWSEDRKKQLTQNKHYKPDAWKLNIYNGMVATAQRMLSIDPRLRYNSAQAILDARFVEAVVGPVQLKPRSFFSCCSQRERTYVDVLAEVIYGQQYQFKELEGMTPAERARQRRTEGVVYKADYDFAARNDSEHSIWKGDVLIRCVPQADGLWLKCELKRSPGPVKFVPLNFVSRKMK